jgi:hypothetical protein
MFGREDIQNPSESTQKNYRIDFLSVRALFIGSPGEDGLTLTALGRGVSNCNGTFYDISDTFVLPLVSSVVSTVVFS